MTKEERFTVGKAIEAMMKTQEGKAKLQAWATEAFGWKGDKRKKPFIVEKWDKTRNCWQYWRSNMWEGPQLKMIEISYGRDMATRMTAREARRICTILNNRDGDWEVEPTPLRAHDWK
jgi:hypothetical protein